MAPASTCASRPAGFSIEGYLQFDALFQFSPFQFIVDIGAGVTLKWKGRTLVGVQLALTLAGPSPWHAAGRATFKIWIFSKSVSFDKTFGKDERPAALPPADPLPELLAALRDRRSWTGGVPTGSRGLVSVRDTATSGELRVHPLGPLAVRQRVVPLEIEITRFGNTAPARERRFRITAVHLGGQTHRDAAGDRLLRAGAVSRLDRGAAAHATLLRAAALGRRAHGRRGPVRRAGRRRADDDD